MEAPSWVQCVVGPVVRVDEEVMSSLKLTWREASELGFGLATPIALLFPTVRLYPLAPGTPEHNSM